MSEHPGGRRVVALVLPRLLCELAQEGRAAPGKIPEGPFRGRTSRGSRGRTRREEPLGVVWAGGTTPDEDGIKNEEEKPPPAASVLVAVNEAASRLGVRAGQTVAEAHAFVSRLLVREVAIENVRARLGEIAEIGLGFGPTVGVGEPDTVWVDVTGAAHLAGGEEAMALELASRVRALGHAVRVSVSSGPGLAQAFARWGTMNREGACVVAPAETAARAAELPVRALPLGVERAAWLARVGVNTFGDLARLPRAATASRLFEHAGFVLELAEGRDSSPLVAYVPPAVPKEETEWEEPVTGAEPLLFVLRGLVSRLGARLEGRGEAVQVLDVVVVHDRAVARHRGAPPEASLHFEFSTPLWRPEELFRVIASRLGRSELQAPSVGLRVEAHAITRALTLQLHLSRYAAGLAGGTARGPETLPVVLAELVADVGKDRVGVLRLEGTHRPEKKSRLSPISPELVLRNGAKTVPWGRFEPVAAGTSAQPTRLLPRPIPLQEALRPGAALSLEHRLYTVEKIAFENRLRGVEWWTEAPVSRDYLRIWLRSGGGSAGSVVEALAYFEPGSKERPRLQAWYD